MLRGAPYTSVRENLARLLNEVEAHRDVVIVHRPGHDDVALVSAGEVTSLLETVYLLRSAKGAARLRTALRRALNQKGAPQTVANLRAELGLQHVAGPQH